MEVFKSIGAAAGLGAAVLHMLKIVSGYRGARQNRHAVLLDPRPEDSCPALTPNFFTNKDGLRIFYRSWHPSGANRESGPAGLVIISHGYAEHVGRYEHVAAALTRANFVVFALDHQGHGQSEGDRGYVARFSDFVDDILQLTSLAQERHPTLVDRTFLLGHSLGGCMAIHTMMRASSIFKGAVLTGPAIIADPKIATPFKKKLSLLLSKLLPKLPLDKLPADQVSSDAAVVNRYINDPLVYHGGIRIRTGAEMLGAFDFVQKNAAAVQWPYLLMHGTADSLCLIEGSQKFHDASQSKDKTFVEWDGWFHELYNENRGNRDEHGVNDALRRAVEWLTQHAQRVQ